MAGCVGRTRKEKRQGTGRPRARARALGFPSALWDLVCAEGTRARGFDQRVERAGFAHFQAFRPSRTAAPGLRNSPGELWDTVYPYSIRSPAMAAVLEWAGDDDEAPALSSIEHTLASKPRLAPGRAAGRGALGAVARQRARPSVSRTLASGFAALDAELPGGGWPCHALTEVLQVQAAVAEWRLLAPAMRAGGGAAPRCRRRRSAAHAAPARAAPCRHRRAAPGLDPGRRAGAAPVGHRAARQGQCRRAAGGLAAAGAQEQIRRLQVCAQASDGPVFLCRPAAAQHEPSAAPLRAAAADRARLGAAAAAAQAQGADARRHDHAAVDPRRPRRDPDAAAAPAERADRRARKVPDGASAAPQTPRPPPPRDVRMLWAALLPEPPRPSDPSSRTEALSGLAAWCLQFTPRVALVEPDRRPAVAMEVEASVRLFGGKRRLVERVRPGCADLGCAS